MNIGTIYILFPFHAVLIDKSNIMEPKIVK